LQVARDSLNGGFTGEIKESYLLSIFGGDGPSPGSRRLEGIVLESIGTKKGHFRRIGCFSCFHHGDKYDDPGSYHTFLGIMGAVDF
jgi:hypothetical protein